MEQLSALEKEYFVRDKVIFEFSDFFKTASTRPVFFEFLRESFLAEYEVFYQRSQKLKTSTNIDEAATVIEEMIKDHIENDAPQLLNLSSAMQQQCLTSYSEIIDKYKLYKQEMDAMKASQTTNRRKSIVPTTDAGNNLNRRSLEVSPPGSPVAEEPKNKISILDFAAVFTAVERYVLMMLSEDVFPRFVRSKTFHKWYNDTINMKNKTEASSLLRQVASLKTENLRRVKEILYDQEEFTTAVVPISQKDVDFTKQLLQDADYWEMLDAHNDGTAGFITKVPFVTSIKSRKQPTFMTVKFISYLPFDLASIAITLFEHPDKSDPNIVASYYRGFVADTQYPGIAGTNQIKIAKYFLKNREHDQVLAPIYDPETQELAMVWKTAFDRSIFPQIPKTVQIVGIGANFLKSIDGDRTKLTSIMVMSASKAMFKPFVRKLIGKVFIRRRQQIFSSLVKKCEEVVKNNELVDGFPAYYYHTDKFGMTSALEDYCAKHLKPEQYPKFVNQPNQAKPFYPDRRSEVAGMAVPKK